MAKKMFIIDTLKTIVSSLLMAFGLQLVAYPLIQRTVGNAEFGHILTSYTILTITSVVMANTLNNIRLVNIEYYDSNHYYSLFIRLFLISIVIESIGIYLVFHMMFNVSWIGILALVILNLFMCLRIYLSVFFRMKLQYNKILIVSVFQFVGILVGLACFKVIQSWLIIFLVSELFALAYTFWKLKHIFVVKTKSDEPHIVNDYLMLLGTNALNNSNLYLDRLILLPLINGTAVTFAFLATFVGKMLATFLYPVNNVLLSYVSVNANVNKLRQYTLVNTYGILAIIFVTIVSYPATLIIVKLLYHLNPHQLTEFIIIGNIGVLLNVVSTMIQTLNTKHSSITRQAHFITVHTILYIVLAIVLTHFYGLVAFFWITLIANFIKLVILNLLGINDVKKQMVRG
ncbi:MULTISPECIES: capsular biosynthesis protein [Staphylococcus]|uniref:capsular biosynthesis protein n=1 Tax=Staphylococcus TaxID=1279 RepID=UPI000D19C4D4|nr:MULTISPECIES: capsular biosynthesis protein [Staphylococcus]NHM73944.1 capsular biosynthesis protein [Staphylococcus sp. 11007852]NJH83810.1 capsular biosynthesis protein [Staphylococcus agnetis]NJH85469.1 capsular biosynthesis protein [Staphylococcus agnetis]NJI14858.1 capsular biosynthesis protein [Staphylococcus agnetis]PTH39820.1 capsular biosynthesis protein [Staphylococcus agnetis]